MGLLVTVMPATTNKKRVLLALSGGVDSSLCAHLLKEQGYEVEALCLKMSCHHEQTVKEAKAVASQLGLPFHSIDATEIFEKTVVADFVGKYESGKTPNPCTFCNKEVKFRLLYDFAKENGFDHIATGHYAKIKKINGRSYIAEAKSLKKDQSYMLYRLPSSIIESLILPLGDMDKDEVRAEALKRGIVSANKPDSQDICFIPDGDYVGFLNSQNVRNTLGRFIGPEGEDLGAHKGIISYTVGQRKGLGIAYKEPLYVTNINSSNGNVYLGVSGSEFYNGAKVEKVFINGELDGIKCDCLVKVRYSSKKSEATVELSDGGKATVYFKEKQRAVCPGQSMVFYNGDVVLGGGDIESNF